MIYLTIYPFLYANILFSYKMIFGCIFYPCLTWLCISILYTGVVAFILSVYLIKYRFKQVYDRIKACASTASMNSSIQVSVLMLAIHEHNEICEINQRNNLSLRLGLLFIYYVGSFIIDLNIINAFYYDNTLLIIRLLFVNVSCFWIAALFVIAYASASLEKASNSPYAKLNSIIAKLEVDLTQISVENKIKINNLIERLAQTQITVWVLNWFPLNFHEFLSFFAAVVSNFFLIVGLIKP